MNIIKYMKNIQNFRVYTIITIYKYNHLKIDSLYSLYNRLIYIELIYKNKTIYAVNRSDYKYIKIETILDKMFE